MSEPTPNEQETAELTEINKQGLGKRLAYYSRKTGPGWLQAAITLGGGSLAGALFLGTILEFNLMWLQPLAMIMGVIMLSAIAYVTLSTGKRPFQSIKENVSPILAWAWLIAAMMANIVWCLPQFSLASGAVQENLFPNLEGNDLAMWTTSAIVLVLAAIVVRAYDSDNRGIKIFETILKILVGIVVVSFFIVVANLTMTGNLDWAAVFKGLIPNLSYLKEPAPAIAEAISATADHASVWSDIVGGLQKDKIIAAFGTAVGINMTFLLPYSMLRKGWGKEHRGLAGFDLSTGLIIPFMLATGCIVIAAASQFHGKTDDILNADGSVIEEKAGGFNKKADGFVKVQFATELDKLEGDAKAEKVTTLREGLTVADKKVVAMLMDRPHKELAKSLSSLGNENIGRWVFGVGVLGMAVSTIIILMLINGFCLCEAMGRPGDKKLHFIGSLIPGIIGLCFPLIWTEESKAALAIPTSVIGSSLLPIAYFIFLLMMNSKKLLGDAMPKGIKRAVYNFFMILATSLATLGSVWGIKGKSLGGVPIGIIGIGVLLILFIIGIVGFISRNNRPAKS